MPATKRLPQVKALGTGRKPPVISSITADSSDPFAEPVVFRNNQKPVAVLKIDEVRVSRTGKILIIGWAFGDLAFEVRVDGERVLIDHERTERPDVLEHLKLSNATEPLGFRVSASSKGYKNSACVLVSKIQYDGNLFEFEFPINRTAPLVNGPEIDPVGFLEIAFVSTQSGEAVISGWVLHTTKNKISLENLERDIFDINKNSLRFNRKDVCVDYPDYPQVAFGRSGFVAKISDVVAGDVIELMTERLGKKKVVSATAARALPLSSMAAARQLFAIQTHLVDFSSRVSLIDQPILGQVIKQEQEEWRSLPVIEKQLGARLEKPIVSVVVPLFGRFDFVEHQLIEFSRDTWFLNNVELVYVIDDPEILNEFMQESEALHRLYRISFKWLWGGVNRGFSGANNLGAAYSIAPYILFLNSDCFPQEPGWLSKMVDTLQEHKNFAALAPRLVHGDGSIQHAGITFKRKDEWGIWVNHHPLMGLDSSLDPNKVFIEMPAVTGACMLVRREDLLSVGYWDTGYLIGDFEDSDLCFKLRARGRKVGYLPTVQLTHLERQSFKLLGNDDFRQKVVIYNATIHQSRWHKEISAATNAHATE